MFFLYYRSGSASAFEAGADVRTALTTFGVDASHGYKPIQVHALRSLAELLVHYALRDVKIPRDLALVGAMSGFTIHPTAPATQSLQSETEPPGDTDTDR